MKKSISKEQYDLLSLLRSSNEDEEDYEEDEEGENGESETQEIKLRSRCCEKPTTT